MQFYYDYTQDENYSSNNPPLIRESQLPSMQRFEEEQQRMRKYAAEEGVYPIYDPWTGGYL